MAHHVARNVWIVAGVLALSLVWSLAGALPATALAGMVGGSIVGANLPEKWRRKLVVPRLPMVG